MISRRCLMLAGVATAGCQSSTAGIGAPPATLFQVGGGNVLAPKLPTGTLGGGAAWRAMKGNSSSLSFIGTVILPQGKLPAGRGITCAGMQMQTDVLATWSDGSARLIASAIKLPAMAAGTVVSGTLDAADQLTGVPVPLQIDATVMLTPTGGAPVTVNVGAAYAAGPVWYLRRGPLCTEGCIDIAVPAMSRDFQLRCALACFSDGTAPRLDIGFSRCLVDVLPSVAPSQMVHCPPLTYDAVVTVNGVASTYHVGTPGGEVVRFTGSISGNVLTVSALESGGLSTGRERPRIRSGQTVIGEQLPSNLLVAHMGTSGGVGTYGLSEKLPTPIPSQPMACAWSHALGQVWWHTTGEQDVFEVHDTRLLRAAGAMLHRDDLGAASGTVAGMARQPPQASPPLDQGTIEQYMPMAGDRNDIGPIPGEQAVFMITQDPAVWTYCLRNMKANSGIPWHFIDRSTGQPPSIVKWPNIWPGAAQSNYPGYSGWVQNPTVGGAVNGWVAQTNHAGRWQWVPWMLTARRMWLDDMEAQASYGLCGALPQHRGHSQGVLVSDPVLGYPGEPREQAWALAMLTIAEAWLPDTRPYKAECKAALTNNIASLRAYVAQAAPLQGELGVHIAAATPGRPPAPGVNGFTQDWTHAYWMTTLCTLNRQGHEIRDVISAYIGFLAGPFLNTGWPLGNLPFQQIIGDKSGNNLLTWAAAAEANDQAIIDKIGTYTYYKKLTPPGTVTGNVVVWALALAANAMAMNDTGDARAAAAVTAIRKLASKTNAAASTLDDGPAGAAANPKFAQLS